MLLEKGADGARDPLPFICMIHLLLNVAQVDAFTRKIVRKFFNQKQLGVVFSLLFNDDIIENKRVCLKLLDCLLKLDIAPKLIHQAVTDYPRDTFIKRSQGGECQWESVGVYDHDKCDVEYLLGRKFNVKEVIERRKLGGGYDEIIKFRADIGIVELRIGHAHESEEDGRSHIRSAELKVDEEAARRKAKVTQNVFDKIFGENPFACAMLKEAVKIRLISAERKKPIQQAYADKNYALSKQLVNIVRTQSIS